MAEQMNAMAEQITLLDALKAKNPELEWHSVRDDEFRRYGCQLNDGGAVDRFAAELIATAGKIDLPESGSLYEPSTAAFEALPGRGKVCDELYGELPAQVGYCYGHNNRLNALEWHKSSEVNVAVTPLVLLLAKLDDVGTDGRLDSAKVKAFLLERGDAVEVYADTLHFCPCEVAGSGFGCVVVLPEGTNKPLERAHDDRLLYRKNKWIFCCEDNAALIIKGVVPAIYGENREISY